jgi:hypothetical protein
MKVKCPLRAARAVLAYKKMTEGDEYERECKRRVRGNVKIVAVTLKEKGEMGFPLLTFGEEERGHRERVGEEILELAEVERVVNECRVLVTDIISLTVEKMKEVRAQVRVVLEGVESHNLEGGLT